MSSFQMRFPNIESISPFVKIWLITGLIMIFVQIVIGGITRLTGSGLSITRWEIITGTVPPLSEAEWQQAFDLYKATPQYQKINQGMSIDAFRFIYFWEYFHRLWARLMFFVFVIPFSWFLWKKMLTRRLYRRLLVVVALAGLEGFLGWIMVASGLIHRPWVNAYNLTLHLCMALVIFSHLLWTTFIAFQQQQIEIHSPVLRKYAWAMLVVCFVQIAFGAMMSGTKAGLFYPTWPDMHGHLLPPVLWDGTHWTLASFREYDTNPFMPALIQFLHRNTAYLLTILAFLFVWTSFKTRLHSRLQRSNVVLLALLLTQVLLGIFTLLNCRASIPVVLGVIHQACAVLLLGWILWTNYQLHVGKRETGKVDND